MKKISVLLLFLLIFTQCQNNIPQETSEGKMSKSLVQELTPEQRRQLAIEQKKLAKIVTPKMNALSGKWQGAEDAKSMIEIKGNRFVEYYEKEEKGNAPFAFYNKCKSQGGIIDTTSIDFIVVTDNDTLSRCYYVELTGNSLKLTHAEEGTAVLFKKVK